MDKILKSSYERILEDDKFVKLTVFSLLPYSLVFVGYLFYQVYFFISSLQHGVHLYDLKIYIERVFSSGDSLFWLFLIVFIIGIISYFIVPPIAEGALISYLNKGNKSISTSLGKGLIKFFQMFELHGFLSIFSFLFFFIALSRLYIVDMLDNFMVITFMFIWLFFVLFFSFSAIYSKYLIILENMNAFEAIKESIKLSFLNFKITGKYFLIYMMLYVRIIINILIIIGIPLLFLYIFLKTNIFDLDIVKYIIYFIMLIMFIITAYINGVVEAFFISIWNDIYSKIEKE